LHDKPDIQSIILDDAFKHREIKADMNILLTDYNNLFTRDFYLPTGDLRDLKSSYKRAELIVVTKCDPEIDEKEKNLHFWIRTGMLKKIKSNNEEDKQVRK